MAINWPTTIDSFTTKTTSDDVEAAHINDLQSLGVALETKVGVDGSAITTSHDYKINALETAIGSDYAGGESTTLPNGLILKMGKTSTPTGDVSGTPTVSVTYGTAFPNGVIAVNITPKGATYPESLRHGITASSASSFTIQYSESQAVVQNMDGFYWMAIGY